MKRNLKVVPPAPPVDTVEVAAQKKLDFFIQRMTSEGTVAARTLADFSKRFANDPAGAFEWSNGAFQAAAKQTVVNQILYIINAHKADVDEYTSAVSPVATMRDLRAWLYQEVLNKAKWPERSTSPQSNEMSLHRTAAMAECLDVVDQYLARM